jgi:DNA-binding CsgD family transcriptional regulator
MRRNTPQAGPMPLPPPHVPLDFDDCRTRRQVALYAVETTARLVRAEVVTCDEMDLAAGWMFGVNNARGPGAEALFPEFLRHADQHPVLHAFLNGPRDRALRLDDTGTDFEKTDLYRRFYAAFGIRHQLIAPIEIDARRVVSLAVFRTNEAFPTEDLDRLNAVVPRIQSAWKACTHIEHAQRDAFRQLGYELVPLAVGYGGPPLTEATRRILADRWGPNSWEQQLEAWKGVVAAQSSLDVPASLIWEAPEGIEVRAVRLPDGEAALAVRAHAPHSPRRSPMWNILSPREREVAEWLVEGKTSAVVATLLGVKEPTVRKHLEHIYLKLGVENRASAIRALLESNF